MKIKYPKFKFWTSLLFFLPTGLLAEDAFVTVWLSSVNLRVNPKLDSPIAERVQPGDPIQIMGKTTGTTKIFLRNHSFDEPWYNVRLRNGKEGWIFGGALALPRKLSSNREEYGARFPDFQLENPSPFLSTATLDRSIISGHLRFQDFGSMGGKKPQGKRMILAKYSFTVDVGGDSPVSDYFLRYFWDGQTLELISRSSDLVSEEGRPMLEELLGTLSVKLSTNTDFSFPWKTEPDPTLTINTMTLKFGKITDCPTEGQGADIDSESPLWMNGWRVYRGRPEGVCWEYSTYPGNVIDVQTQNTFNPYNKLRFKFREAWDPRDYVDILPATFALSNALIPVQRDLKNPAAPTPLVGNWYVPRDPKGALVKDYYLSVFRPYLLEYLGECQRTGDFDMGSGESNGETCSETTIKKAEELISFEEYSKRNPLLFLRDALGRWVRFHNTANFPPQF